MSSASKKFKVKAGIFNAYKLAITQNLWNSGFEYYVPNVGMILKEYNIFFDTVNPSDGKNTRFVLKTRKELVTYNVIPLRKL